MTGRRKGFGSSLVLYGFRRRSLAAIVTAALVAAAFSGCASPGARQTRENPSSGQTFGEVRIVRNDVYDLDERPGWFYRIANALNVVIREEVIRREVDAVWQPGEPFDPELLEELERNLRRFPFISEAVVSAEPGEDDSMDVLVETRDNFSLEVGLGLGFFGGSSKSRLSIAESDVFGYGKRAQVTYKTDPDKDTLETKFTDPQFLGTDHVLDVKLAQTTDGHEYVVSVGKPFKTLATKWSYGLTFGSSDAAERFFEKGDEIAKISLERQEVGANLVRSFGPREQLLRIGGRALFRDDVYGDPEGDQPEVIEVPDDARVTTAGPTLGFDWLPRFEKWQQVDAIDFVEDIPVGIQLDTFVGLQHRDPRNDDALDALAFTGSGLASTTFRRKHIFTLGGDIQLRQNDRLLGWEGSSFAHYYFLGAPWQTWVFSAAADGRWETEDLNTELTLGEDSGLRGYPTRQFSGRKRLRFNVEDRIFTPLEVLSVHLGAVVFYDAGYVWDRGEAIDFSDLAQSVGFGLRLGSARLLGRKIVRIDVGFPLVPVDGESFSVSVSATVQQVITLFRNTESLENGTAFGF